MSEIAENTLSSTSFESITGEPDHTDALATAQEEVTSIVTARSYSNEADFTMDEIAFPRLRLAQGQTPEVQANEARAGQWVLTGEQAQNEVVVVPLAFTRRRELRVGEERKMACQSPNAKYGVGEFGPGSEGNPTGECADCPMSKWQANPRDPKKNLPPPCTFIYSYVVYSVTHNQVVTLELSKTGMTAAKFLNTLLQQRNFGNFAVRLASVSQRSPRGTFYVPDIKFASVGEDVKATAREAFALPA